MNANLGRSLVFEVAIYVVVLALLVISVPIPARVVAQLRGRLDRVDQLGRHYPAAGISSLCISRIGHGRRRR
jgi:hypothetical protein